MLCQLYIFIICPVENSWFPVGHRALYAASNAAGNSLLNVSVVAATQLIVSGIP